jgi:MIP family channel proteins
MNLKAFIAELIGTFGFVLLAVGSMVTESLPMGRIGPIGIAIGTGLALGVMVSATLVISGGYLNPAITIAAWLTNRLGFVNMIAYVIAQVAGGLLAVRVLLAALPRGQEILDAALFGSPAPGMNSEFTQVMAVESIGAALLMLVVMGTVMDKRCARMGGLFVGLAIVTLMITFSPYTGGSFNPARYLGPALAMGNPSAWFPYVVGPILGAAVMALIYQYLMGGREDRVVVTE